MSICIYVHKCSWHTKWDVALIYHIEYIKYKIHMYLVYGICMHGIWNIALYNAHVELESAASNFVVVPLESVLWNIETRIE